ncbi:hypothetical protein ACFE04_009380 [Oxalis oulophora]
MCKCYILYEKDAIFLLVFIAVLLVYAGDPNDRNNFSSKVAVYIAQFASTPSEAETKAQQAVKTMVSKGYILGKDAFIKAKAFDDSYQSSMDTVKSVDEKYQVSDITKAAILVGATAGLVFAKIVAALLRLLLIVSTLQRELFRCREGFIRGVKAAVEIGQADQ